jgi:2-oxoglutarate ferredoxin oxidoreductase subunit beta
MKKQVPERVQHSKAGFCPGCGYGVVIRLIAETMEAMKLSDKLIAVVDVGCGSLILDNWRFDTVQAAHGRPTIVAAGIKKVRKENPVLAFLGDGAAYSIGLGELMHAALRNENIVTIVVNNGVFGMTGGQKSPTTIIGQKTVTSRSGRDFVRDGQPFDVMKALGKFDIAYLARGSVESVALISKASRYFQKAFEKQSKNEGFCLVEILSPCPTNWNLPPTDSIKMLKENFSVTFPTGEFVERTIGGKNG